MEKIVTERLIRLIVLREEKRIYQLAVHMNDAKKTVEVYDPNDLETYRNKGVQEQTDFLAVYENAGRACPGPFFSWTITNRETDEYVHIIRMVGCSNMNGFAYTNDQDIAPPIVGVFTETREVKYDEFVKCVLAKKDILNERTTKREVYEWFLDLLKQ
jgi:hypothetical protein